MIDAADFAQWVTLLLPLASNGAVAVIWIGVDESGTHGGPVLALAGVFGSGTQWQSFREAWAPYAAMYESGYHAKAARSEHNRVLAGLIRRHLRSGLTLRMSYADIREIIPHEIRSQTGEEYFIGMVLMVQLMAISATRMDVDELAYVIEAGHRSAGNVAKMFDYLVSLPVGHPYRQRVHSASWVGKEEIITHAADLVSNAWAGAYVGDAEALELVNDLGHDDFIKFVNYKREHIEASLKATKEHFRRLRRLRKKDNRKRQ